MSHAIVLGVPGSWELQIAGREAFVLELANRLGLYSHRLPAARAGMTPSVPAAAPVAVGAPAAPEPVRRMPRLPAPPPPDSESEEGISVGEFYRGFLGDRDPAGLAPDDQIVLFGYYLQKYMGKETWATLDISTCYTMAGIDQPRNLIGLLSQMARQKSTIVSSGAGYTLSERSLKMIETAIRAG